MSDHPYAWEAQLTQTGRAEITMSTGKKIAAAAMGIIFAAGGAALFIAAMNESDVLTQLFLGLAGLSLLALVVLSASWFTGRWNMVVTWDDVGYRHARVPWNEIEGVGQFTQQIRGSKMKLAALILTPRGNDILVEQMGGFGGWLQKLNTRMTGVRVLTPGKLLAGSLQDRIHWLGSVHMKASQPRENH